MKLANRVLALVLSILMLLSAMPVFADAAAIASFSDFPRGTWSEEAMTAAVNNSLLKGKGNGTIAPRDYLTRAEAAAVINRAFGATVKADISAFTDVQPGTWYYDEIAKAVNMQTIVGVSATKANPTGNITRESMLAVLARALVLDEADASELSKFTDGSSVSPWAKGQVAAMAKRGYVNGNEKKELNPQSYITREEFAQVMHNIFKVYIPETVTIDNGIYGTTVIRAKDVTLNNVTINGDLIAGDGVGDGNLNLTNVTVTGRILFRGGEGKVKLTNTTVGEKVVINDVNGVVNFLNYRAEEPFKNIQENTKATFLNMKVNTGGGGSSTPSRAEYKIREYVQDIDGSYPSSAKYTDEKMADYGETITYNPRNIEGFTFDATHPDSVLSGTNKGNLTLKAYYTRNKYTVSFDGYEVELPYGEKIRNDNPLKDKMLATKEENEKAGYNTEFKDGTGKEVTIDDTTVGAEDLPIYAIKTPIEYKINYNLNGGKIEGEYDKTYNVEKEIILPVNVVKKGYTFGGWTDENGAPVTKIDVGTKGNKTFNANWNIVTYEITYEVGPYGALDGTEKTKYTVEDADFTLPTPDVTKDGYVFKGWYINATFTGRPVTILDTADAENKTYYALIEEKTNEQYTIKFDGKTYTVIEGEKIGDAVDSQGNKLSDAMDNVTYPKGYEADNFRIKGDDTTVITKDTIATEDMEIVAAKKAIVYTITYVLGGGTLDGTPKEEYTVEDADYTLPEPTKAGSTFLGWYEDGVKVTVLDTADAENKTYVASWRAPAATVYKVTFKGTDYDVTQNNALYTNEDLKDAMDEASVKQGYNVTFNTKADGTGAIVDTSYVPTGDVTIYAIEKAIVYTITYEENGCDNIADDTYTIEDADITLPVPTREGYVFRGWYEEAGFSGDVVTVLDTADLENKTYYAKWVLDNAVLSFDHEISGDIVTLKVMLNAIPADIDDIAAMSIRYDFNNTKLEYVNTTSNVGEVTAASAGYISWYTTSNYITADTLAAKDNVLFTITFNVKDEQYGTTEVSYTSAEITASEPVGNPAVAEEYTKKSETIDLGTQVQTYTITYVENGGDDIPDGSYKAGDKDITLPIPTRADYAFKGWYEESDFSGDAVVELDTADAEDKTYYAKWVIETATLGFSSEIIGNTVKIYVTLDEVPSDIDEISAFTLKYKHPDNKLTYVGGTTTFGGQFSSQDGYISWYNENTAITSEALKANDNIVATLEFSKTDSASGSETFEYTSVEIVASKPEGNPAIARMYITGKKEVQLDAATYVVAFDGQTYNITVGNALSSNALLVAAMNEAAKQTGYTVTFNTKEYGSGEDVTTAYVPAGSMTVYIVKNANEYSITYELDGGKFDGTPKEEYTVEDEDYTLPTPVKAGYTFLGWYENGTKVDVLDTADAENKTYTAKWEATEYTITYVLDGGALDDTEKTKYTVEDANYTLPTPAKAGYTFLGWYENDTKVEVLDTADAEDKTYTAKWEEETVLETEYKITYVTNGGTLDGTQKKTYKSSDPSYTLPIPEKGEVPFLGWYEDEACTGEAVTVLAAGSTGNKTYYAKWQEYTVQFYVGTKRTGNKPTSDDGDQGKMIVEHGATLTQVDVDRELGMLPSEYEVKEGYVDSDGVVHEIVPELWYLKNGEWTKFVPEEIQIVSDMDIHLFIRFLAFEYNTDLEIKGIDMSKLDFSLDVPYDSYTDIGKTYLDFLTNAGGTLDRVLGGIETQGYDLYQMAIDKAASKGLVDTDGNIMNPNVPLPIHRFITEEMIMEEIDRYIDANINNEDFIADLLRNDAVVEMIIGDEELKHTAMGDPSIREIFLTDDFIKEIIKLHPEFVDIIIDHDEFVKLIIDNDATFDYVLKDDTMVAEILDNDSFKNKIIEKGTDYIVDNYFGTSGDQDVKDYITKQLKSADVKAQLKDIIYNDASVKLALKDTLITDEDAKDILKDKIKGMLDDPETEADIRGEVRSYLLSNSTVLRADIKDYISENSASLRDDIKAYIGNNSADLRDDIKTYIGGNSAGLRSDIKAYIGNNSADLRDDIKSYIGGNSADLRDDIKGYIESQKETIKGDVISYIETKADDFKAENKRAEILDETANPEIWNAFKAEFETLKLTYPVLETFTFEEFVADFLNGTLAADHPAEYVDVVNSYNKAIDDNLTTYVTNNYDDLFVDYFDDYYTNLSDSEYQDLFNDNFSGYYDGLTDAEYQDLFDDNFSGYYDGLTDAEYQDLFDDNFSGYYDGLTDAEYQDLFDDNFSGYYDGLTDAEYQDLFDDNFSGYYDGLTDAEYQDLFNDNFAGYFDGLTSQEFKDLFNSKFEDFFEKQYDDLFDEYFDDYFDTMFDSLYESNVEKWAKMAYDEPTTKTTVIETIEDVIIDLINSYIVDDTPDQELKDFINKIVKDFDVKGYVRDNYYTDSDLKATIDGLVKDNAKDIIADYANNTASDEIVKLIDENMHKYIEEIVEDYVNYDLDEELMAFIDEEINIYMRDYINKYIDGTDRTLLSKLVPTYAHDAVEAIKETDAFKNTITDFASGNGVRVNKDNLMFVEVLDELMHTYNYDKLASDFLPEKIQKVVDLIGHDTVAHIVDDYFAAFCLEMDTAIANLKADQEADIEDTEYKFSTTPAVRINYMEIIDNYYTTLTGKLRDKINSQSKVPVSSNPYAQRLVDMDYFALIFDRTGEKTEYKSGYKLKDDIMEYYDNMLMLQILVHDAVTFYGSMDTYTIEDRLDSASLLVGTYANKLNDVIMNFVENGELPKGYTLEDILDINGKIEILYNKFKDKIEKGEDLYAEYLDRDYTDIVDFANMSIYSGGDAYKIYQIILENGEDAFDLDDAITAVFDSPNYHGVSKIEDAMAKVEAKIKDYAYDPSAEASTIERISTAYVDGYKGTFESREIKGYETGTHTLALQRYLR